MAQMDRVNSVRADQKFAIASAGNRTRAPSVSSRYAILSLTLGLLSYSYILIRLGYLNQCFKGLDWIIGASLLPSKPTAFSIDPKERSIRFLFIN